MTPAELNHWAATDVMGWKVIDSPGLFRFQGWWVSDDVSPRVKVEDWNPCESHDDCQRVIEKAIERGVKPRQIVNAMRRATFHHPLDKKGLHPLTATAEQKLRAVYEACKEMEKK